MELRSPDPSVNPYLAFALIISAGLDGIENKMELPSSVNVDLFTAGESLTKNLEKLPDSLKFAAAIARNSKFIKKVLGETLINKYLEVKQTEIDGFEKAKDKMEFYNKKYFSIL